MAQTLDARLEVLRSQLHAISLSIGQAKARKDQAGIDRLQALWNKVNADLTALQRDAKAADSPSAFMQTLSNFSDEAIKTGRALQDAGASALSGIGATLKYLPVILLVALVVVGLVYAGKIRKDLK